MLPPEERICCRCSILAADDDEEPASEYNEDTGMAEVEGAGENEDDDKAFELFNVDRWHVHKAMFFGPRGETFERIERRFLVDDIKPILKQLRAHGKTKDYGVTTMYLDHQMPTWAVQGESRVKFRLRRYDTGDMYFEQKVKYNGVTYKKRNKTNIDELRKDLIPVGIVSYQRTEFEQGKSRITVDRELDLNGRMFRRFVVEVKGDIPKWLELPEGSEAPDFSKSRSILRMCDAPTIASEKA